MKKKIYLGLMSIVVLGGIYWIFSKPSSIGTVSTQGECARQTKSDRLSVAISITNRGKEVQVVSNATKKSMRSLIEKINSLALENLKIETQNYALREELFWDEKQNKSVISGFESISSISVETTSFDKAGQILDAVASFSDGRVDTLETFVSPELRQKLYSDCLIEAGQKALQVAEKIAKGLNASVGSPVSVQEIGSTPDFSPIMMRAPSPVAEKMDSSLPISPKEESITVRLSASFEIY